MITALRFTGKKKSFDSLVWIQAQLIQKFVVRPFGYEVITKGIKTICNAIVQSSASLFVLRVQTCTMSKQGLYYSSIAILARNNERSVAELIPAFCWTAAMK